MSIAMHSARAALVVLALTLGACGSSRDEETYVEAPVEQLYQDAADALAAERYITAVRLFNQVEQQHPYSVWATKAQLMSAFASYANGKYDEAVATVDRFIALHPGNRDVAYAYYLRAIAYYEQITDVRRDQRITGEATRSLDEVVRRFPESDYARDARIKLDLTRDHLAGKEMDIGRYYLRQGHHLAAINRFRRVVTDFQTTSHVPEALHRLVESYVALGVREEAQSVQSVLCHNDPDSVWCRDSFGLLTGSPRPGADRAGWLSRNMGRIF
jgi:outer membrane protein assembly factor BamD